MSDYTPLDITRWSNVSTSDRRGQFGLQVIRGLPFNISPIRFCREHNQPLEIPIHAPARWIIIAHQLSETFLPEGEPVGRVIAYYRFTARNEAPVEVAIRERFEIGFVTDH